METTLRWQISKTIHFIFNCFWCVPDFEYSDKEIMKKLLFCSLSYTSNTQLLFLHPHSLAFLDKLEESNPSFLPGLSFRRSQSTDVLFEESFQGYNWHHFSWEAGVFFLVFYQLKARLKSWDVLSFGRWLSIHEQFCWGSTVGPHFCHRLPVETKIVSTANAFQLVISDNTDPVLKISGRIF